MISCVELGLRTAIRSLCIGALYLDSYNILFYYLQIFVEYYDDSMRFKVIQIIVVKTIRQCKEVIFIIFKPVLHYVII